MIIVRSMETVSFLTPSWLSCTAERPCLESGACPEEGNQGGDTPCLVRESWIAELGQPRDNDKGRCAQVHRANVRLQPSAPMTLWPRRSGS